MTNTEYFTQTPDWLLARPDISHGAKFAYSRLARYARLSEDGAAWPSMGTLGAALGVSARQAYTYVQELAGKGLLAIEHREGITSRYTLVALTQELMAAPPSFKKRRNPGSILPNPNPGSKLPTPLEENFRGTSEEDFRTPRKNTSDEERREETTRRDQQKRERAPATDPEVTTIIETAAGLWSRGKHRAPCLNAAQVRRVQELMDRYQLRGRPRGDVLDVMKECAGNGWGWATFLSVAQEELDGTRRRPVAMGARSQGNGDRRAALTPVNNDYSAAQAASIRRFWLKTGKPESEWPAYVQRTG